MLSNYLQDALNDLNDLIKMTESDIENIKKAEHSAQFERVSFKEDKVKSFESKKALIDREISTIMAMNPHLELNQLLNSTQFAQLDQLKLGLNRLRDVNRHYAKMVLSVSAFYNSLLEKVVPTEMNGYSSVASKNASFMEVRA